MEFQGSRSRTSEQRTITETPSLMFSNNKQERKFASRSWKENLVEADEGYINDLKQDPMNEKAFVFDGNGNYPTRYGKKAVPIVKNTSRVAMYIGGDHDDCFAADNDSFKWKDWQYLNAYCALRAVSKIKVNTTIANDRLEPCPSTIPEVQTITARLPPAEKTGISKSLFASRCRDVDSSTHVL